MKPRSATEVKSAIAKHRREAEKKLKRERKLEERRQRKGNVSDH